MAPMGDWCEYLQAHIEAAVITNPLVDFTPRSVTILQ